MYQDFGHSHWQSRVIWDIGFENISILARFHRMLNHKTKG
jgi:hypothetical protein